MKLKSCLVVRTGALFKVTNRGRSSRGNAGPVRIEFDQTRSNFGLSSMNFGPKPTTAQ